MCGLVLVPARRLQSLEDQVRFEGIDYGREVDAVRRQRERAHGLRGPPDLMRKVRLVDPVAAPQDREFEPVGSSKTEQVDVRIVAATNQNLEALMREGLFREDLYFRLNVVPIEVPSLRERREDIPLLVEHFLNIQRRQHPGVQGITSGAMKRLEEYQWPGNVRELQSLLERLAILRRSDWIEESDLPHQVGGPPQAMRSLSLPPDGIDFSSVIDAFEADLILQALETTGWNKNQAANLLGLKRTTLVEKIRSKGLTPSAD